MSGPDTRLVRDDRDNEDPNKQYCLYCEKEKPEKKPYENSVTSNIRSHILRQHKIDIKAAPGRIQATTLEQLWQLYFKAQASGQTEAINDQVF